MKKATKKRASKYEEKLHYEGNFLDLVNMTVSKKEIARNAKKKKAAKKK